MPSAGGASRFLMVINPMKDSLLVLQKTFVLKRLIFQNKWHEICSSNFVLVVNHGPKSQIGAPDENDIALYFYPGHFERFVWCVYVMAFIAAGVLICIFIRRHYG